LITGLDIRRTSSATIKKELLKSSVRAGALISLYFGYKIYEVDL